MIKMISEIENIEVYAIAGVLLFFGLIEIISGALQHSKRNKGDWIQELGSFTLLTLFTKPAIVLIVYYIGIVLFPDRYQPFAEWNFWFLLIFYILIDDVLQYWYHRSAHEYQWLWKLHRPHHQAEEMGFFIAYRNAALYYLIMPNIWWISFVIFLGGAKAVAIGLIFKQLVIIASHSTVTWDSFFYKRPFLKPLMTILERIIVTPAFHHSHHGKSRLDGISDPNANFGNTFSIWDQLFGTATFPHEFPTALGLVNDPKEKWTASIFYPIITSNDTNSEISKGFKKQNTKTEEPITVQLEKDKKYLWCQCGQSNTQPFCDGSHQGSKIKPVLFTAKKSGKVKLCNCKATKKSPFCDDSHLAL